MALEIPTTEPTEVYAGDLIKWTIADDPDRAIADAWFLTYSIVTATYTHNVVCTDNGDGNWLAEISSADSTKFVPGKYKWQKYLTKGSDRYVVGEGYVTIRPNFATSEGGFDDRSDWAIILDNVTAVIKGRATKDQSSYTVNGRQLSRTPIADLLVLYDKAKINVSSEEKAESISKGLGNKSGTIKLRF